VLQSLLCPYTNLYFSFPLHLFCQFSKRCLCGLGSDAGLLPRCLLASAQQFDCFLCLNTCFQDVLHKVYQSLRPDSRPHGPQRCNILSFRYPLSYRLRGKRNATPLLSDAFLHQNEQHGNVLRRISLTGIKRIPFLCMSWVQLKTEHSLMRYEFLYILRLVICPSAVLV